MKKKRKVKNFKPEVYELFHNRLFKPQVIKNKKKEVKKFDYKKEMSSYLCV